MDLDNLRQALRDETILVSVMGANNETGVLQPLAEIGALCHERGILFHTDAAQALGKVPIDVRAMNIDLLSISAHKLYGPKGVGALYVRQQAPRVELMPLIDGGGQELGMRPGTLNVPGIVGLGKACEISLQEMPEESRRLQGLRDRLKEGLFTKLEGISVNGSMEHRLPHNLNVSFSDIERDALLLALNDVALSSGSACTSAIPEPSYVLKAMEVPDELAYSSIRFGLGRFNTGEEVDYVIGRVVETVHRLREVSPSSEAANAESSRRVGS